MLKAHAADKESIENNTTFSYFFWELLLCILNVFLTPVNNNQILKYFALAHIATHVITAAISLRSQKYLIDRGLEARRKVDLTFELGLLYDTFCHVVMQIFTGYYLNQAGIPLHLVGLMFVIGMGHTAFKIHKSSVSKMDKDD
ncbi:Tnk2 [Acrasis kona]|uniref:Tnk2 n=1 Tax=Acrasis kona TaxID=1008807 RepID=A0AAW2ZBG2_9EUKA